MNAVKQAFEAFKRNAALLEREEGVKYDAKPAKETIRRLLDGYCEAMDRGDERRKDLYASGLMLRFWYVVGRLEEKSPNLGLETVDFMSWLYEAIEYACKYRKWQDHSANVNAQQCLNQCIETIRLQHYYECNLDRHRANYNVISFANPLDDEGKATLEDTLSDEAEEASVKMRDGIAMARELVQAYLNKDKVVEAIILDVIAFNDSQKVTKKSCKGVDEEGNQYRYSTQTSEFWPFKCVQLLNGLADGYEDYFLRHYKVSQDKFEAAFGSVRKATNQKLYKFVSNTLADARRRVSF